MLVGILGLNQSRHYVLAFHTRFPVRDRAGQPHDHLTSTETTLSLGDVCHVVRSGEEAGSFRLGRAGRRRGGRGRGWCRADDRHPGYRPPPRDGLTGLGVHRRNRPADPAPRPGLPHAAVRRPGAARRPRPDPQGRRPPNETNAQGLCESYHHAKQAAGWHSRIQPGRRHELETSTPTGHTYRSRAPATWPAAPPLATTGSTSCSAHSSGSPPERRRCRRPRLASDPWQPCCPSCS